MDDAWAEIVRAAEAGDSERVADLALALDPAARKALDHRAWALYRRLSKNHWHEPVPRAAQTARFALGPPFDELDWCVEPPPDRLEALVRARPRRWRDTWAEWAVERGHHLNRVGAWIVLRTLIREGVCARPDADHYTAMLVRVVHDGGVDVLRGSVDDVWLAFARGDGRQHGGTEWEAAVLALAADGTISRDRLLDETLAAIERAPTKHWRGFHATLAPTDAEFEARLSTYLRWLESDRDALVGFALGLLTRWDKTHPLDAATLLDRLGVAVNTPAKGHARRALTLVGRALDREPGLAPDATQLLADALDHAAVEVQAAALKIAERHPAALPADHSTAHLDPSLRPRAAGTRSAVPVPPPPMITRVGAPVTPIEDIEELLDLASRLIEGLDDPDECERFVDGLSRLCDQPVAVGRRAALLKRTRPWARRVDAPLTTALIHNWLATSPDSSYGWTGPSQAIGRRLAALTDRIQRGEPDILLSAPTHRGGFLDSAVLAERLQRARHVDDHDLAQALLRTETPIELPNGDLPASEDTLRLLADPEALTPEPHTEREDWSSFQAGPNESPARTLARWETVWDFNGASSSEVQRWLALVWPGRRALYYACVWRTLWCWQEHWDHLLWERRLRAALTAMHYPEPLGADALSLLAFALLLRREHQLPATDVVIDAIATRRLDGADLGARLAAMPPWPQTRLSRLAMGLEPVADSGPLHRHELQRTLETLLPRLEPSSQLIGLIDLLRRLVLEDDAAVSDPSARTWLEQTTAKGGKLARAALAVTGDGAERSMAAAAQARTVDAA